LGQKVRLLTVSDFNIQSKSLETQQPTATQQGKELLAKVPNGKAPINQKIEE